MLDADGLGPFLRFGINVTEKLRRRAEYAATEDDLLRVEQADEVRHGHAPKLDGLGNDFSGNRVAAVVSGENVPRGCEGWGNGVMEYWGYGPDAARASR